MTSPSKKRTLAFYHDAASTRGSAAVFSAGQALTIYTVVVAGLVLIGPLLFAGLPGALALLASQVGVIAGVPVAAAWLRRRRCDPWTALGLRRPGARALLGAVCVGASFWYLSLSLLAPISIRLTGSDDLGPLEDMLARSPPWLTLAAAALAPALCEEILLRGVLARGLQAAAGTAGAVIASAVLFALLHLEPVRLLPTAVLGALLAYAALRTQSIVPCIIIHFLNNAIALVIFLGYLPGLVRAIEHHPLALAAAAAALTGAGMILVCSCPAPEHCSASGHQQEVK